MLTLLIIKVKMTPGMFAASLIFIAVIVVTYLRFRSIKPEEIKNNFFRSVSEGSVKDLQKLLGANGRKITTDMAKSFNECGETPLLLAIKKNNHLMVAFLVEVLDALSIKWEDSCGTELITLKFLRCSRPS